MSGSIAPFGKIIEIAEEFNAMTYLDEVHAVGIYGKEGEGMAGQCNYADKIDIIQGTLGKAFGVIGGYIASTNSIVDAIRSTAPGFIFTTTLPPCIAAAATASIRHLRVSNVEREKHREVVMKTKRALTEGGIDCMESNSHIIPVFVGDAEKSRQISLKLLNDFEIYVQNINFPTVPIGRERLRITPTPLHRDDMIEDLVKALKESF
jgi:5-aminolevulinate synthase